MSSEGTPCWVLPKRPEAGRVLEPITVRDSANGQSYPGVPFCTAKIAGQQGKVLFDSAAAINYLSQKFASKLSVPVRPSPSHTAKLADGSTHPLYEVMNPLRLQLAGHSELIRLLCVPSRSTT